MTATHAEGLGHKIFMDNFFSPARPFYDLDRRTINSCRTIQPSRKDMPHDFVPKQLKFKRGDVMVKTRGGLTTLVWKDRGEDYMLTKTDPPPAKENFCDDSNRPMKPHPMEWYNWHMG
jgi:hypothetical protein